MFDGNNSFSEKIWGPPLSFFRGGNATISIPLTGKQEMIAWKFSQIQYWKSPLSFVSCTMNSLGIEAKGFGDSFLTKNSMIQAFAEAWERLWMSFLTKNKPAGFPEVYSSNGLAAGKTGELALIHSRYELIERTLFLIAWRNQCGWAPYKIRGSLSKALNMFLENQGWQTQFYRICDNALGAILAGFAQHSKNGVVCDTVFVHHSPKSAELKLLRSLMRGLLRKLDISEVRNFEMPERGKPEDHAIYYSRPENGEAFAFLNLPKCHTRIVEIPGDSGIISRLIVPASLFPAVAISYNPNWPELCWGRQCVQGKNPWPHPLA